MRQSYCGRLPLPPFAPSQVVKVQQHIYSLIVHFGGLKSLFFYSKSVLFLMLFERTNNARFTAVIQIVDTRAFMSKIVGISNMHYLLNAHLLQKMQAFLSTFLVKTDALDFITEGAAEYVILYPRQECGGCCYPRKKSY